MNCACICARARRVYMCLRRWASFAKAWGGGIQSRCPGLPSYGAQGRGPSFTCGGLQGSHLVLRFSIEIGFRGAGRGARSIPIRHTWVPALYPDRSHRKAKGRWKASGAGGAAAAGAPSDSLEGPPFPVCRGHGDGGAGPSAASFVTTKSCASAAGPLASGACPFSRIPGLAGGPRLGFAPAIPRGGEAARPPRCVYVRVNVGYARLLRWPKLCQGLKGLKLALIGMRTTMVPPSKCRY